jgi:O-antigen biosynthesis protein
MFHIRADRYFHFIQRDDRQSLRAVLGNRLGLEHPFIDQAFADRRVGFIVVARWLKEKLERESGTCVVYAPNGVDTRVFHPGVRPLSPRGQRPRVLIEGPGGIAFKRVELAFRVARRLPGIEAWYVSGDGVVDSGWKADRIFRQVPMEGMPEIYASCDILLKLSIVEGFFGPPLEMMACGGAAVVTRVMGHDEYVVDGHNALTVPLDDEWAACAALNELVEDRTLRARLAENGIRTAQQMDWAQRHPLFEEGLQFLVEKMPPFTERERAAYAVLDRLRIHVQRTDGRLLQVEQAAQRLER